MGLSAVQAAQKIYGIPLAISSLSNDPGEDPRYIRLAQRHELSYQDIGNFLCLHRRFQKPLSLLRQLVVGRQSKRAVSTQMKKGSQVRACQARTQTNPLPIKRR